MTLLKSSVLAWTALALALVQSVWLVPEVHAEPPTAPAQVADRAGAGPDYFTDGAGKPLFIVSAEDWGLLANATLQHADPGKTWNSYFAKRQAQGYNAVEVSIFGYGSGMNFGLDSATIPEGGDPDPGGAVFPFTPDNDPTTANNATWWQRRSEFFAKAAQYGFTVLMNITTPNLNDSRTFTTNWTNTQWQAWGKKLGQAFGSVENVKWMFADDYYGNLDDQLTLCLKAMRAAGADQPVSIQYFAETDSRTYFYEGSVQPWGDANADFYFGYSYGTGYDVVERAGNEPTPKPYGFFDGMFLNSLGGGSTVSDRSLMRRIVWQAVAAGTKAVQIGDNNMWTWDANAMDELSNPFYNHEMPTIARVVRNLPHWWELKADTSDTLVTAGRGTHWVPIQPGEADKYYDDDSDNYVPASYIQTGPDKGTLAVLYFTHANTVKVDESKLVPGYTATWVDPASGARKAAVAGPSYTRPSTTNSANDKDWVLVLSARALPPSATVPGRPAPPRVAVSGRRAVVRWSAPPNGGSPITAYRVTLDGRRHVVGPAVRRYMTGRLAVGHHRVTVAARNRLGYGAASSPTRFRIRR